MRNIKLTLEYDGTDFNGWQWQPSRRTVQGTLQSAVDNLVQESPKLYAAGRTDAGVHALGQVVNFKTNTILDLASIRQGLNSYLPSDLVVLNTEEVDEGFHARFDAEKRKYRYVISKRPLAIGRQFSWFCKYDLDFSRMQKASNFLLGEHVFSSFCKETEDEEHYLSNVERAVWQEDENQATFEICARRFLRHMVRVIVGTLVDVGRGRLEPGEFKEILESKDRRRAGTTAPAKGLRLERVYYTVVRKELVT